MARCKILFLVALSHVYCEIQGEPKDIMTCGDIFKEIRSTKIILKTKKNETGDWTTTFKAWKEVEYSMTELNLNVNQKILDCGGKQVVYVQGVINGDYEESLTFHPNCGTNIAISNDGLTIRRIRPEEALNGVVLTNRPLRNNELFEVRLDEKGNKFKSSFGIGVTSYSPSTFKIPDHMWNLKSGNWIYYYTRIHKDGTTLIEKYGQDLNGLKVGDRVGVLRNNFGTLHYFINGVDQGPAASNIPYPVYGVYELKSDALKATIVNRSER